jgi:hypothetical protein
VLKAYEPRIMNAIDTLCKCLDDFIRTEEVIDFSVLTEYMAFDIMGDLGFVSHKLKKLLAILENI